MGSNWASYIKYKKAVKEQRHKYISLHVDSMEYIKKHYSTHAIIYQDYKESYDYVDAKFPGYNVRQVKVFKTSQSVLEHIGYRGVGGLFDKVHKIIIIDDRIKAGYYNDDVLFFGEKLPWDNIKAIVSLDEVLVHELLHYVSSCLSRTFSSVDLEEEFAYGHSVGYLRKKGLTDDDIIKQNFLPFLIKYIDTNKIIIDAFCKQHQGKDSTVFEHSDNSYIVTFLKKNAESIYNSILNSATQKGKEIIRIIADDKTYQQMISEKIIDNKKSFKFLDI